MLTQRTWPILFALIGLALPAVADQPPSETLLLQQPTVSAQHVVFVYAQDLWIVSRSGGDARRLTSHVGAEYSPRLSPDGKWVAFTAAYQGNNDVYLLPVSGGLPKRLTWHPGRDRVQGWHPDGKRILFSSGRIGGARVERLFLVSVDGGMPTPLAIPKVAHASYNADASRIAYTPVPDAFRSWKRYRGGRTTPVWIYDPQSHAVEQIPHKNASDTFPCWLDGQVYFASDRGGRMNIWRYRPRSEKPERLTDFKNFDVRNMSTGGGVLVFEQAGALHLYHPKGGKFTRLRIRVSSDGLAARPRWQSVRGFVRSASISPNGKRVAFEARGEIIAVPRESGDARNLTRSPGVHDRSPAWSPDGQRVAWFSDRGGEYRLVVRDRLGRKPGKRYDLGGARFYHNPSWSPDGQKIMFFDKGNRIAYITLKTGQVTQVAKVQGSLGVIHPDTAWSRNSRWIAFQQRDPQTSYDRIVLFNLASGKTTVVTDQFAIAHSPAFSRDGKYLYFAATVQSGARRFGLDMGTSMVPRGKASLYVVVLSKTEANPLAPRSDEAVADKKKAAAKPKKGEKAKKKPATTRIDLDGLDQRILALPLGASNYYGLACSKTRLLFIERPDGGSAQLKRFDFTSRKATYVRAASGFEVAHDGKSLLVRSGRSYGLTDEFGKNWKGLKIDSVKVRVDPQREWPQMLHEAWRLQRDYFYDKNMHGVDWPAMGRRYRAFLPHVRHRADLNLLIAEMIGELCCGHQYVRGGEMQRAPRGVSVGLLGADIVVEQGRHRIRQIYRGQNWNPGLRAPLTGPGVDARVGDFLIAVDGQPLRGKQNLYAAFENKAGRQVELVLSAKADGSNSRKMTVVPLSSEGRLRQRSWIERNRKLVDKLSGGKLAYVYMPDTGRGGLAAFNRDFFSQLGKQGVVIDERYNRGGKVADYVINILSREPMCYWMNREEWLGRTPFGTMTGPKVMVINERAGSGGDAMPWLFRRHKLGKLVGTRTWGGLVGISGYPPLMDGGSVTSASFGVMDTDGNWAVENVGVAPDIEVIEWPKQVIAGHDPQLERAVQVALDELKARPSKKLPVYKRPSKR